VPAGVAVTLGGTAGDLGDPRELHRGERNAAAGEQGGNLVEPPNAQVGLLEFTCEVLLTLDDVRVLALLPTEGTDAREKLDLLRVIGVQDFHTSR
jgi:hypothetical protein